MPRELFDVVVGLQLCGLLTPLSPISLINYIGIIIIIQIIIIIIIIIIITIIIIIIIIIIIVIIIISCFVHWLISSQPLYLLMERVITHEKGPLDFDSLL